MSYLYLAIDLGAACVPAIFSFHPRIRFHREFGSAFAAIALVAIAFIAWDIYFTSLGIWGFNGCYITGPHLANLPIEEVLFFVMIPFSCLFTYFTLHKNLFKNYRFRGDTALLALLGIAFIVLGSFHLHRHYTSWACILCGVALIVAALRRINATAFLLAYLVLLIPFFIVNGILTGTGLDQPVVWYNNLENLGIRILTIPIEDFIYGMLMIMLNIMLFDIFRSRPLPPR